MQIRMLSLVIPLALAASANASLIFIPNVSFDGGTNLYTYDYSMQNTEAADILSLQINVTGNVASISSPANWSVLEFFPITGTDIQWTPVDVETGGLHPNQTLSGFRIVSAGIPGDASFEAIDADINIFSGNTTGPVNPVPEPAGFLLAGCGLLSLFAFARLRRRPTDTCGAES